jgi:hypothetical protein
LARVRRASGGKRKDHSQCRHGGPDVRSRSSLHSTAPLNSAISNPARTAVIRRSGSNQAMEHLIQLVVVFFAAPATGGLMVNWIGLGRAMSRLSGLSLGETSHLVRCSIPLYSTVLLLTPTRWCRAALR